VKALLKKIVTVILHDDTTENVVGDGAGDITFTIPEELDGWDLINAQASIEIAGTTGTYDMQIHNVTTAVDMLSTVITIDSTELTSYTAATPSVVDAANDDVSTGDKIRFDVDSVHTTEGFGEQAILTFALPL